MLITIALTVILLSVLIYFIWKRFLKAQYNDFLVRDNEKIKKELERRNKVVEFKEGDTRAMYPLTPDECYKKLPESKTGKLKDNLNT